MNMNENLRRALEALERGAVDARTVSARSVSDLRSRLRTTVEEVLDHLEADEEAAQEPEDVIGRLDRQSRDIAEDLRRVERLMKQRLGHE
jgi:hypothetical protein